MPAYIAAGILPGWLHGLLEAHLRDLWDTATTMRYPIKRLARLLGAAGLARSQLGLEDGTLDFSTSGFTLSLVKDSQTLYSLVSPAGFDYIPGDIMGNRSANGSTTSETSPIVRVW